MRPPSRWRPGGLQSRLTAWVAAVMLVSVAVIFFVVYSDTGTVLRQEIDRDVTDASNQLEQPLRPLPGRNAHAVLAGALRYVSGQPYGSTSTLLLVLVPGA